MQHNCRRGLQSPPRCCIRYVEGSAEGRQETTSIWDMGQGLGRQHHFVSGLGSSSIGYPEYRTLRASFYQLSTNCDNSCPASFQVSLFTSLSQHFRISVSTCSHQVIHRLPDQRNEFAPISADVLRLRIPSAVGIETRVRGTLCCALWLTCLQIRRMEDCVPCVPYRGYGQGALQPRCLCRPEGPRRSALQHEYHRGC